MLLRSALGCCTCWHHPVSACRKLSTMHYKGFACGIRHLYKTQVPNSSIQKAGFASWETKERNTILIFLTHKNMVPSSEALAALRNGSTAASKRSNRSRRSQCLISEMSHWSHEPKNVIQKEHASYYYSPWFWCYRSQTSAIFSRAVSKRLSQRKWRPKQLKFSKQTWRISGIS